MNSGLTIDTQNELRIKFFVKSIAFIFVETFDDNLSHKDL